jgi:hypothetical protein
LTQYLSNFNQKFEPTETYIDPVSKIRVSTPENLIDTDFEYGLQGTKWETVELVNNIPSFYVSDSDNPLSDIISVNAALGSEIISVNTQGPHGLLVGSPIDVRGLSSRTAEGKFLIKSVTSPTTFTFVANGTQTFNGNIGSVYTTITPGNFYSGSQIPFRTDSGITTDAGSPCEITVSTPVEHGHVLGTNVYMVNTFGTKEVRIAANTSANAPDGRPFVDPLDIIVKIFNPSLPLTETKQMRGTYYKKLVASDINTTNNTITWIGNDLKAGDCLLYTPPSGDVAIGGLARFQIYYVVNPTSTTVQLSATRGGAAINFTTTGSYNFGRAGLHLVYEIAAMERTTTQTRLFHRDSAFEGDNSGWDWSTFNWGLGRTQPSKMALIARNGATVDSRITNRYYSTAVVPLNAGTGQGMVMPETTNTPTIYNFIEDFTRYETAPTFAPAVFTQNNNGLFFSDTNAFTSAFSGTVAASTYFFIPLVLDEERDSVFAENHGLSNGQQVNIITEIGANPLRSNNTSLGGFFDTTGYGSVSDGTYVAEVISPNRFRFVGVRLAQLTGTYQLNANIANDKNNSFYFAGHGYTDNEIVTVKGGALPGTRTGLVFLDSKVSTGNLRGAWTILNNYMNSYTDGLANHQDLVLNGFKDSNIFVSSGVSGGTVSGISSTYYESVEASDTSVGNASARTILLNKQEPTIVQDAMQGTLLAGRDFGVIGTKWLQNSVVPHYSVLYTADATLASKKIESYLRADYTSTNSQYAWSNRTHTISGNADWRSSASFAWSTRSSATNMVQFEVVLWNEAWNEALTNSFTAFSGSRTTPRYITGDFNVAYLRFVSTFMVSANSPMTNANADTLINNLITNFATNFQEPTLLENSEKAVRVISKDRFYLEEPTTALEVNIEEFGGADTVFEQKNQQGILDGAYSITSIPAESQFVFNTPFTAAFTEVIMSATTVTSENFIKITNGHNFITGARVNYYNNGNTSIANMVDEGSYYVYVQDDEYIGLCETFEDAISGVLIDIAVGSGNHRLTTEVINGRSVGAGTVNVERGNKSVLGTDTLFKRYFKVGDVVSLKDNNETPGTVYDFVIAAIADDSTMQLETEPNFSATDTKYLVSTKIYVRPDGYSVHRPFDGGVEISTGTSPNSQVIRQTRKYFRYQSGKGIQTSLAINFNPPVQFETLFANGLIATGKTRYPHRLTVNSSIRVSGSVDSAYNGTFAVATVIDDFSFTYNLTATPTTTIPAGIIQFNMNGYTGAFTRAGMFDNQNGFFFEFDGRDLWCVRRSSTQQLSGKATVFNNQNLITGIDTNFLGQLSVGDFIVIRGGSYRITKIRSNSELIVQPQYKGISSSDVILTKTVDTKVKQSNWSIDRCDGTGPSGYDLNLDKIQMAYMDYSWYGAGKIRFGFKDTLGHVKYVHEFVHNNLQDEAYMRSGNLPARYELQNAESASYNPTLFHWGTSIIMDGTFDNDNAYLFTSTSNTLSYTNGQSLTATTNGSSVLVASSIPNSRDRVYRVRLSYPVADANKFSVGTPLFTDNGQLNGQNVEFTQISGSTVFVYILLGTFSVAPITYPIVASGVLTYIGASPNSVDTFNLGTDSIPLITIRLAPSVDSGLSGNLGAREIINRMQLILNEVGLILTHDCDVSLVLNADLSNVTWENVNTPSLSQLIRHNTGDRVIGGTNVFSFRAAGGSTDNTGNRLSNTSNFSLGELINMGNSILGGNGTFPNGPDILTVVIRVVNTAGINATNKFIAAGRITWSESQA